MRPSRALLLGCTSLVLLAGCTSGSGESAEPEPSESVPAAAVPDDRFSAFVPCPPESLENAFTGTWLCGSVQVPLDRDEPLAGTLTLPVFAMRHTDLSSPALTPFFTTPGGPGGPGFENFGLYAMQDAGLVEHHDIVTMDPRGTGQTAIDCPDLQDGFTSAKQRDRAVAACAEQLGASSDRYGATDRATDLEAVRAMLGYETIDYYAPSYAGVDAQAYAVRFPERLRSLVIDSSFRVDDVEDNLGSGVPASLIAIAVDACDESCRSSVGDPAGVVSRLVREVAGHPIRGEVDGHRVVVDEVAVGGLLYTADVTADLVEAAAAALTGDERALVAMVSEHPFWSSEGGGPAAAFSQGANAAGQCNDLVQPWDWSRSVRARRHALDQAMAALPDEAVAPFTRAAWTTVSWADYCIPWRAPAEDGAVVPQGSAFPAVPTLLLVGERDVSVPGIFTERLAEEFPTAELVGIPGAQHPSLNDGSGCSAAVIATFIETLGLDLSDCAHPYPR